MSFGWDDKYGLCDGRDLDRATPTEMRWKLCDIIDKEAP